MNEMKMGTWVLIIGGLLWGLVGLGYFLNTNLNIVNLVFGSVPVLENLIYVGVGICALWVGYLKMNKKM
jgi:uncharacterized membrane protein YuzA (DUF378 family)